MAIPIRPSVILLAALLLTVSFSAHAQTAAGTLAYTYVDGAIMLLLADHATEDESDRGWGGFGGSMKEGESPAEAAARETEEESRGYFARAMVERKIRDQKPVIDGEFALYFLEVPNDAVDLIHRQPVAGLPDSYHERGPYAWLPFASVSRHLKRYGIAKRIEIEQGLLPEGAVSSWYWNIWLGTIVAATRVNALPWHQNNTRD